MLLWSKGLTLLRPKDFSIKLYQIKSGWFIIYIEGSQVIISKIYLISFSEDQFCLANCAYPDEILPHEAFHLGLHCLL